MNLFTDNINKKVHRSTKETAVVISETTRGNELKLQDQQRALCVSQLNHASHTTHPITRVSKKRVMARYM